MQNCEHVVLSGGGSGGGGAGTRGGSGGGSGSTAKLALAGSARATALLGGRLAVSVPCAAACRLTVTAKKGGTTVATGGAALLSAGTAKARLNANAKARRALKRTRTLTLAITATVTGADGKRQKLTRTIKLRSPLAGAEAPHTRARLP